MTSKNFSLQRNEPNPDANRDTQGPVLHCAANLARFKSAIPGQLLGLLISLFCFGLYASCSAKTAFGLDAERKISQYGHANCDGGTSFTQDNNPFADRC